LSLPAYEETQILKGKAARERCKMYKPILKARRLYF
jgi:hypothetical protein